MAKKSKISINLESTRYEIVEECATELGWRTTESETNFMIFWLDTSCSNERVTRLKAFQRINHFPGMTLLSRKAGLARRLQAVQREFPAEFSFFPRTFILPDDHAEFSKCFKRNKKNKMKSSKVFIVKPDHGCQGKGIFMTRSLADIPRFNNLVVQDYLSNPFLIDKLKFDLRVYVVVLSCSPLRIYLFDDGLVRFCTKEYQKPTKSMKQVCAHLTNYSINKHSDTFQQNSGEGDNDENASKRSIVWFKKWLDENGHDSEKFWKDVGDICVKTLISVQPRLEHVYRSCLPSKTDDGMRCFEILGFDIMLDDKLKPWLIEVNHSPSFTCDSPLDTQIKKGVIFETMRLLRVKASDKRNEINAAKLSAKQRLYSGSGVTLPPKEAKKIAKNDKTREEQYHKREVWEKKHMKRMSLVFPPNDPDLMKRYEAILAEAGRQFESGLHSRRKTPSSSFHHNRTSESPFPVKNITPPAPERAASDPGLFRSGNRRLSRSNRTSAVDSQMETPRHIRIASQNGQILPPPPQVGLRRHIIVPSSMSVDSGMEESDSTSLRYSKQQQERRHNSASPIPRSTAGVTSSSSSATNNNSMRRRSFRVSVSSLSSSSEARSSPRPPAVPLREMQPVRAVTITPDGYTSSSSSTNQVFDGKDSMSPRGTTWPRHMQVRSSSSASSSPGGITEIRPRISSISSESASDNILQNAGRGSLKSDHDSYHHSQHVTRQSINQNNNINNNNNSNNNRGHHRHLYHTSSNNNMTNHSSKSFITKRVTPTGNHFLPAGSSKSLQIGGISIGGVSIPPTSSTLGVSSRMTSGATRRSFTTKKKNVGNSKRF